MVGDFSFSDSVAQLALATAVYWWASASFHWRFRSFFLALFVLLPRNFRRLESWFFNSQVSGSECNIIKKWAWPQIMNTPSFTWLFLYIKYCTDRVCPDRATWA